MNQHLPKYCQASEWRAFFNLLLLLILFWLIKAKNSTHSPPFYAKRRFVGSPFCIYQLIDILIFMHVPLLAFLLLQW